MQPDYEKPVVKGPEFTEPGFPCYDYRNMENAGKYQGVGSAGKVGHRQSEDNSIETMPPKKERTKVRRDHRG